jgi:hypothetical protein
MPTGAPCPAVAPGGALPAPSPPSALPPERFTRGAWSTAAVLSFYGTGKLHEWGELSSEVRGGLYLSGEGVVGRFVRLGGYFTWLGGSSEIREWVTWLRGPTVLASLAYGLTWHSVGLTVKAGVPLKDTLWLGTALDAGVAIHDFRGEMTERTLYGLQLFPRAHFEAALLRFDRVKVAAFTDAGAMVVQYLSGASARGWSVNLEILLGLSIGG